MITLEEFVNKWLGKKCDYDGFYGGQCVDLYRQYVKEALGFPQSPGVGGATEIWYTASDEYYDFIENTIEAIPVPGDIPIWNRNVGGGFGHVDIVLSASQAMFTGLDQNWPTLDKVTKTKHNYDNIIGWLHPKEKNMSDMYELPSGNKVDLGNRDSNIVLAKTWDEVVNLKVFTRITQAEIDAMVKFAKEEGYADGFDKGFKAGSAGESQVTTPGPVDPEKWEENGLDITIVEGNKTTHTNYKLK